MEGPRQRHPSGGVSAKEMVIGLEGVELGADGKVRKRGETTQTYIHIYKNIFNAKFYHLQTVSYTQFLYPTNVLGGRRNTIDSTSSFVQSRNASHRSLSLGRANSNQSSLDTGQSAADGRPNGTDSAPSSPSAVTAVLCRERAGGLS